MDDVHLEGLDIDTLRDGVMKDTLINMREDIYFPALTISMVEEISTSPGGSLPPGGNSGQLLVKQSGANGDADWEPLIFTGGGA